MSRMGKALERIRELAQKISNTGDPSHDFEHIQRVVRWATWLGRRVGADLEIVEAAAYLHDRIQVPKNHPDRALASALSAETAESELRDFGFPPHKIPGVLTAIREHSFSAGLKASTLESSVVQDADRLDAIGAVGVARAFVCGTRLGSSFYEPADPCAEKRTLNDRQYVLDHFPAKLLKLEAMLNTEPARAEARRRARFMDQYLAEFRRELSPEA